MLAGRAGVIPETPEMVDVDLALEPVMRLHLSATLAIPVRTLPSAVVDQGSGNEQPAVEFAGVELCMLFNLHPSVRPLGLGGASLSQDCPMRAKQSAAQPSRG